MKKSSCFYKIFLFHFFVHPFLFSITPSCASSVVLPPITVNVPDKMHYNELLGSRENLCEDDIKRAYPKNLVDILRTMNGISIAENGTPGSVSSLFIRGGNPNHTLFISDGLALNDPSEVAGAFSPLMWSSNSVTNVTLSKGVMSKGNAITAVIEAELSKGEEHERETSFSTGYGSFDTNHTLFTTKGAVNRFHYHVTGSHFKSQGYRVTPLYLRKNTRQFLTDPSSLQNIHARFDGDIHDNLSVTWFTQAQTSKNEYASSFGNPFRVGRSQSHYNVMTVNGKKDITQNILYKQKILAGFLETKRQDGDMRLPFLDPTFRQKGGRSHTTWSHSLEKGPFSVLGELSYTEDRFKSYQDTTSRVLNLATQSWVRGFVVEPVFSSEWREGHHIKMKASLRCDHHKAFRGVKTYTSSIDYTFPSLTTLSFAYGTAYKAPSLFQLYGDSDFSRGNRRLRPEHAHNMQWGVGQSFSKRVRAEVMCFSNHLKHMIQGLNREGLWTYDNIQRAKIDGIESSLLINLDIFDVPLRFKAGHTYLHTQDKQTGLGLLRRPKNMLNLQLDCTMDMWDVGILFSYKGRGGDRDPVMPQYLVSGKSTHRMDVFATYHATKTMKVFARIENALNRRHDQDPLGYQRPGLSIYGGVTITLGPTPQG